MIQGPAADDILVLRLLMGAVLAPRNRSHGFHAALNGCTPIRKIPQTKIGRRRPR
jgi:hypothetical protein